ncbi:hypothetical protein IF1G_05337 [Cordyceps javanica]|uniref:Uncharacterized protein n=1 Tax=Cordyceps javanica TaxID=43265 RepID=A0A545V1A5_9HYPO|nr:hypothetical protein IF1G_05337 [Cordyceps javanica]TQW07294.1 hypothetical protein IF2G_05678 [Cordyceps javanica]
MDRIKKTVVNRIAGSTSATIPNRLQHWAQERADTLAGGQATNTDGQATNTDGQATNTDGTSDETSAGSSSAPDLVSSSSSLPTLEVALKRASISPRGCLKPSRRPLPGRSPARAKAGCAKAGGGSDGAGSSPKRVSFARDDALVLCLRTSAHIQPVARNDQTQAEFLDRSYNMLVRRREDKLVRRIARKAAGIMRAGEPSTADDESDDESDDDDDDDDDDDLNRDPWDVDTSVEDPSGILNLRVADERTLQQRLNDAGRRGERLKLGAIAGGCVDFALHVTRSEELLGTLENMVRARAEVAKVASYRGDERPHARPGVSLTRLADVYYDDFPTAMSGSRAPDVIVTPPAATMAAPAAAAESSKNDDDDDVVAVNGPRL